MKVLALASYPTEAASTRYRLTQYVEPLAAQGIEMTVRPFINSTTFSTIYTRKAIFKNGYSLAVASVRRIFDGLSAGKFDVLLVQREAMLFGPPIIEKLAMNYGKVPMILDLDDATYVSYKSPTYGKFGSALKWFGKTDDLIKWSSVVTCGNRNIAEYVKSKGVETKIIPTVVDTDKFCPRTADFNRDEPVLGWIGTHSSFQFLQTIFPVLQKLAEKYKFRLKIVGAGCETIDLPGVKVENLPWNLQREIFDFQSLDIGLYPIDGENLSEWALGKSGFKAIQYMAVGVPFVVTPIGVCAEIGVENETHFSAYTPKRWYEALEILLTDSEKRRKIGAAGRQHALDHYQISQQTDKLASVIRKVAENKKRR